MGSDERPMGVTLIGVIFLIVGAVFVILGILAMMPVGLVVVSQTLTLPVIGPLVVMLLPYMTVIAVVVIIGGAIAIVAAIGLFSMKKWGWYLGILGSIVAIVIIIGIFFILYLIKEDTKMAFGNY